MLIQILFLDPILFLIIAIAIILSLSIHEYFHAWAAYFLGDPTPKDMGRLTINPLAHLDPLGTMMIFLSGFGWGKPVPINSSRLRNHKWGNVLIGIAGPAANFLMAIAVGIILRFFQISNTYLGSIFSLFIWINLALGLFNLMPIPPLDGSHIFLAAASEKIRRFFITNSIFFMIGLVLFAYYIGFDFIIRPLFTLITGLPSPF